MSNARQLEVWSFIPLCLYATKFVLLSVLLLKRRPALKLGQNHGPRMRIVSVPVDNRRSKTSLLTAPYCKLGVPVLMYQLLFCTQTVLRLRKRVTLMVVSVSAIFVISWGGDTVLHILEDRSFKLSPLAIPIAHVVIMFNAAVNPFAYALINERFRHKMKEMMCSGSRSLATKHFVTSARALHEIQRGSIAAVTLEEQMSKGDVTRDDSQQRF